MALWCMVCALQARSMCPRHHMRQQHQRRARRKLEGRSSGENGAGALAQMWSRARHKLAVGVAAAATAAAAYGVDWPTVSVRMSFRSIACAWAAAPFVSLQVRPRCLMRQLVLKGKVVNSYFRYRSACHTLVGSLTPTPTSTHAFAHTYAYLWMRKFVYRKTSLTFQSLASHA